MLCILKSKWQICNLIFVIVLWLVYILTGLLQAWCCLSFHGEVQRSTQGFPAGILFATCFNHHHIKMFASFFFFFLFWLLTCLEMIVSMFHPINICKIVRLSCKIFHFNVIGPKTLFSVRYDTFVLCFMKVVQFLLPWILCKKLILYLLFLVSSTKEVSYSTEQYSVTINMVLIKIICNDDVTNFHTEFFDQSMELD